ncbi:uncharacterized protein LOC112499228 isoform X2 [Citrus sinensis]|uniref:uncharacterized protein LOC112499228 isoform X2 n=1 Tax=Citrus sinensis TaxID=2711 RepID=UPI0022787A8F|nr:uncharacterized protein LOC112499228 isoform X2 [Citrus sinensis]
MLEELKLIQYAFNKEADGSYREILNRHSLLTLLPEAYLCGEVVEKDVAMNWYLPTRYSQEVLMVRDEVDFFARAARYGKNYMQHVHRCQKIYVPINDESSHWYLLIVNVRNTSAEIWDPLPDSRSNRRRHDQTMHILHSLDWILQPQLPSNMQHFKFKTFQSTGALEFQSKGMDIIVGFM